MNQDDPSGPDEIDKAWLESIVPEGCISDGFVAIVSWMDQEGKPFWRVYSQINVPLSTTLGLIELAKLEMVARSDTGLPLRYPHLDGDDDDD